jgi:hypothetical protein
MDSMDEKQGSGDDKPMQEKRQDTIVDEVFVEKDDHQIHYRTLSWQASTLHPPRGFTPIMLMNCQFVACLMTAEIVSNGMLSLPGALAVVVSSSGGIVSSPPLTYSMFSQGIVPGVILIVFLGVFGLFTAKLLIDFKLNHPQVHSMGRRPAVRQ